MPMSETSENRPLYAPSPKRAITAVRASRRVTKTCAPMNTARPRTRIARPIIYLRLRSGARVDAIIMAPASPFASAAGAVMQGGKKEVLPADRLRLHRADAMHELGVFHHAFRSGRVVRIGIVEHPHQLLGLRLGGRELDIDAGRL